MPRLVLDDAPVNKSLRLVLDDQPKPSFLRNIINQAGLIAEDVPKQVMDLTKVPYKVLGLPSLPYESKL
ncbi:MAG: hypothetical protein ABIH71_04815, partial [Candidatus Omnitrophota bacterium]